MVERSLNRYCPLPSNVRLSLNLRGQLLFSPAFWKQASYDMFLVLVSCRVYFILLL